MKPKPKKTHGGSRTGAGRPQSNKVRFQIKLPAELDQALRKLARKEKKPISELITEAIGEMLKTRVSG